MKKNILRIMVGSIIVECVLVCILILAGNLNSTILKAMSSVLVIFCSAIPCLFYSRIYDDDEYKYIAVTGSAIVGIHALISILSSWKLIVLGTTMTKVQSSFSCIIWTLAFISIVLSYISVNDVLDKFKKASVLLLSLFCIFSMFILWTEISSDIVIKLYFILLTLTGGSFLCTLILNIAHKKDVKRMSNLEVGNGIAVNNNYDSNAIIANNNNFTSNNGGVNNSATNSNGTSNDNIATNDGNVVSNGGTENKATENNNDNNSEVVSSTNIVTADNQSGWSLFPEDDGISSLPSEQDVSKTNNIQ